MKKLNIKQNLIIGNGGERSINNCSDKEIMKKSWKKIAQIIIILFNKGIIGIKMGLLSQT